MLSMLSPTSPSYPLHHGWHCLQTKESDPPGLQRFTRMLDPAAHAISHRPGRNLLFCLFVFLCDWDWAPWILWQIHFAIYGEIHFAIWRNMEAAATTISPRSGAIFSDPPAIWSTIICHNLGTQLRSFGIGTITIDSIFIMFNSLIIKMCKISRKT